MKWSTDSRYLALFGSPANEKVQGQTTLFIFDREANQYVIQCTIQDFKLVGDAFWSPDNRYIAYTHWGTPLDIFDMQTENVFKLADDAKAVGWSKQFPVKWP